MRPQDHVSLLTVRSLEIRKEIQTIPDTVSRLICFHFKWAFDQNVIFIHFIPMKSEALTSEVKLGLVKFQLLLFLVEFFFQELVLQRYRVMKEKECARAQDIRS